MAEQEQLAINAHCVYMADTSNLAVMHLALVFVFSEFLKYLS